MIDVLVLVASDVQSNRVLPSIWCRVFASLPSQLVHRVEQHRHTLLVVPLNPHVVERRHTNLEHVEQRLRWRKTGRNRMLQKTVAHDKLLRSKQIGTRGACRCCNVFLNRLALHILVPEPTLGVAASGNHQVEQVAHHLSSTLMTRYLPSCGSRCLKWSGNSADKASRSAVPAVPWLMRPAPSVTSKT